MVEREVVAGVSHSDREDGLAVARESVAPRMGGGSSPSGAAGYVPTLRVAWGRTSSPCRGSSGKDSERYVTADSVPWPSAEARASPAERQHWCPRQQTTPLHHTAQCPRTRTLSWCFFAVMSMTSAMAASSRTPSSRHLPTWASGAWGRGHT